LDQFLNRVNAQVARVGEPLHRFGIEVEADYLVAAQPEPLCHVSAHLAKTNKSELHVTSIFKLLAFSLSSRSQIAREPFGEDLKLRHQHEPAKS
jgi:hypothetical protein